MDIPCISFENLHYFYIYHKYIVKPLSAERKKYSTILFQFPIPEYIIVQSYEPSFKKNCFETDDIPISEFMYYVKS